MMIKPMMSDELASKFVFVTDDTVGSIVGRWGPQWVGVEVLGPQGVGAEVLGLKGQERVQNVSDFVRCCGHSFNQCIQCPSHHYR